MTMIMTALAIAAAQGQPTAPPQTGHAQHQQMHSQRHAQHQQPGQAKDGDGCCKDKGCDMPCCAKHKGAGAKTPDVHQGHDG